MRWNMWTRIGGVIGVVAILALIVAVAQLLQSSQATTKQDSAQATQIAVLEQQLKVQREMATVQADTSKSEPTATAVAARIAELQNTAVALATLQAQSKTTNPPVPPSPQIPIYNIVDERGYSGQSLDENVSDNSLVCLTTGPITVPNTAGPLHFPGNGRATAICWIGRQRAQALNLAGSSLKHVIIESGSAEEIAILLVRRWGQEMTTRADGCGVSYGPCEAADLAVIRADGSVIRP